MKIINPCKLCRKSYIGCFGECAKNKRYIFYLQFPLRKRIRYIISDWICEHKLAFALMVISLLIIIYLTIYLLIIMNGTTWEIYRVKTIWLDKDVGLSYELRERIL